MTGRYSLYALRDPRKDFAVFYIGKTSEPSRRLIRHIKDRYGKYPVNRTVKQIIDAGLRPELVVINRFTTEAEVDAAEIAMIKELRDAEIKLTNLAPGGEGGWHKTSEQHSEDSRKGYAAGLASHMVSEQGKVSQRSGALAADARWSWKGLTAKERSERARRVRLSSSPEHRNEIARAGWETRRARMAEGRVYAKSGPKPREVI